MNCPADGSTCFVLECALHGCQAEAQLDQDLADWFLEWNADLDARLLRDGYADLGDGLIVYAGEIH